MLELEKEKTKELKHQMDMEAEKRIQRELEARRMGQPTSIATRPKDRPRVERRESEKEAADGVDESITKRTDEAERTEEQTVGEFVDTENVERERDTQWPYQSDRGLDFEIVSCVLMTCCRHKTARPRERRVDRDRDNRRERESSSRRGEGKWERKQ
jgi:hypothetical protein